MSNPSSFKDFASIWTELSSSAQKKFGSNVDLSPHSPLGVLLEMVAYQDESIWLSLQHASSSLFVSSASGYYLDSLVALRGTTRNPGAFATVTLTFSGLPQVTIPSNTVIQHHTEKSILFITTEETSLSAESTANIVARSVLKGTRQNVLANTLSFCLSPIEGVFSVTNPLPASHGIDPESDQELKNRFFSLSTTTNSSILGLINAFSALPNTTYVKVLENPSEKSSESLPPKSIHVIIHGPSDLLVAQTLYRYKPAGVATYGNSSIAYGNHSYQFSKPQKKSIFINVSISKVAVSQRTWNDSAKADLQKSFQQWLSPSSNFIQNIDKPLDAKSLAQKCASHPFVEQGVTVLLGINSSNISQSSIDILPYEYPFVEINNLTITVSSYAA